MAFALVAAIVPLLPTWNVLSPVGFVVAERVLYSPSIGHSMLVAMACSHNASSRARWVRALAMLCGALLVAACACETTRQLPAWRTSRALWASARANCPRALAGVDNVVVASNRAFFIDANAAAVAVDNAGGSAAAVAAAAATADGAIGRLRRSIEWEPRFTPLHTNLCMLLGNRQRWAEAVSPCSRAVALDPTSAIAHVNLAAALWSVGDRSGAMWHARHAVSLAPTDVRTVGQLTALVRAGGR